MAKPEYKSSNSKDIKKKLNSLLAEKPYQYNAASDSTYKNYVSSNSKNSAAAAKQTTSYANDISQGTTYAGKVSNQSMHRYNAKANELVPSLMEQDYNKAKSNRAKNQTGMDVLVNKEKNEYARHRDKVEDYYKDEDYKLDKLKYQLAKDKVDWEASTMGDYESDLKNEQDARRAKAAEKAAKELAKASKKGSTRSSGTSSSSASTKAGSSGSSLYDTVSSSVSPTSSATGTSSARIPRATELQSLAANTITNSNQEGYDSVAASRLAQASGAVGQTVKANMYKNYMNALMQNKRDQFANYVRSPQAAMDIANTRNIEAYNKATSYEVEDNASAGGKRYVDTVFEKIYGERATSARQYDKAIRDSEERINQLNEAYFKENEKRQTQNLTQAQVAQSNAYQADIEAERSELKHTVTQLETEKTELEKDQLRKKYSEYSSEDLQKVIDEKSKGNKGANRSKYDSDDEMKNTSDKKGEITALKELQFEKKQEENRAVISKDKEVKAALDAIPYGLNQQGGTEVTSYLKAEMAAKKAIDNLGYDGASIINTYKRDVDARNAQKVSDIMTELAADHPVYASGLSVGQNLISSPVEGLIYGANYLKNNMGGEYSAYNTNNPAAQMRQNIQDERAIVSQQLEQSHPGTVGKAMSFGYQTGLSIADSLIGQMFFGEASAAMMGAGAAADTAREMTEQGYDADKVAATSAVAGFAEYIFEQIELDQLKSFRQGNIKSVKDFAMNMAKAAANEGAGEGATDILNEISDYVINGSMSEFCKSIDDRMKAGESFEQAKAEASLDFAKQVGLSVLGGAISGVVMGAVHTTIGMTSQGESLRSGADELISEGLNSNENTTAHKLAQKLQGTIDTSEKSVLENVKNIPNRVKEDINLAMQQNANVEAINAETADSIADVLSDTENGKEAADALGSAVSEGEVSTSEAKEILKNQSAIDILNEATGSDITADSSVAEVKAAAEQMQGRSMTSEDVSNAKNNTAVNTEAANSVKNNAGSFISEAETRKIMSQAKQMINNSSLESTDFESRYGFNKNMISAIRDMNPGTSAVSKGSIEVDINGQHGFLDKKLNNGNIVFSSTDGKVSQINPADVKSGDVSTGNENVDYLLSHVSDYDANGAKSYLAGYDGSVSASLYTQAFDTWYESGKANVPMDMIHAVAGELIPNELKIQAYMNGANDAATKIDSAENKAAETRRQNASKKEAREFVTNNNTSKNFSEADLNAIKAFGQKFNVDIEFFDSEVSSENGHYINGRIYINNNSSDPAMVVALHEYTHFMEKSAPKQWKAYRDAVISFIKAVDMDLYNGIANDIRNSYDEAGVKLTNDALMNEIAANATQAFLSDPEGWYKAIDENKGFKNKLHQFISNFIEYIKEVAGRFNPSTPEAQLFTQCADKLSEIEKLWARAADVASATGAVDNNAAYSITRDSKGNELSEGQQEFFAKSKIVDANGNLRVMYHGSPNEFTVFDPKMARSSGTYGRGFYFSSSNSHADQYKSGNGKLYEVYLNAENPLVADDNIKNITKDQLRKYIQALADDEDYGLENYGYGANVDSVLESVWGKSDFAMLLDLDASCVGDMVEAVKLFNKVNGTNYDAIDTNTETVVFNSNQVKSVDNLNPTADPDINFSLSRNVEEGKNLIAVHNMNAEKLLSTLQLGGFPMPSIAVTKKGIAHNDFGSISILFGKDTIDPANANNKVYSADAWTPTFPAVSTEIKDDALWDINDKLDKIIDRNIANDLRGYNIDSSNTPDKVDRWGNVYEAYKDNVALMYAYLTDTGKNIDLPTKETVLSKKIDNGAVKELAKDFTRDEIEKIRMYSLETFKNNPEIAEGFRKTVNDYYKRTQNIDDLYDEPLSYSDFENFSVAINKYLRDGIRSEVDYYDAQKLIKNAVDDEGFEKWINNLFKNAIGRKGIRNNKDLFTNSGNRRSWKMLHDELTLENVVKNMKSQQATGQGMLGSSSLFGSSAREYKSIDDIKSESGRLNEAADSIVEDLRKEYSERFENILSEVYKNHEFSHMNDAREILLEAVQKSKTKEGIARYLNANKQWINLQENTASDLYDLVKDIAKMPTDYFEAKPRRAVGFDEIVTAVIPDTSSEELVNALKENGIPYETYEAGNNEQRLDILNAHDEALFSINRNNALDYNAKDSEIENQDNVVQEMLNLLNGYKISQTQIEALANKNIKKANSTYDPEKVADALEPIAKYLNGNYTQDAAMVMNNLQAIAKDIMSQANESDPEWKESTKDMRDYFKNTKIMLTDKQVEELKRSYGTYGEFRKSMFGKLNLVSEASLRKSNPNMDEKQLRQYTLDARWNEIASTYPEWFDANTAEGDQLGMVVDAVNAAYDPHNTKLSEMYGAGTIDEMARSMANDMFIDLMSTVSPVDQKEKWNRLRTQYAEKTKAYKDKLDERYARKYEKLVGRSNKIREAMAAQKESYAERETMRKENAERAKYKKDARKIWDSFNTMLNNPTESKYIPIDMVNGIIDVLQEINFDTGFRGPNGEPTQAYMKLDAIKKSYENLRVADSDYMKNTGVEYDQRIPVILDSVKEMFADGKRINDLKTGELKDLVENLSYIYESVRNSTQLIGKGKNIKSYDIALKGINEINASEGTLDTRFKTLNGIGRGINAYVNAILSPERFMRRLVGYVDNSPMVELTEDLTKGEAKSHVISKEIDDILRPVMEGRQNAKNLKKFTGSKAEWIDVGFYDQNGKKLLITPAMRVALYLHLQNNGNVEHIENGGIKIPNMELYKKGDIAEAYARGTVIRQVSRNTLTQISKGMTEYEKAYAKAAAKVFNDYSKKRINETSRQLLGYDKARVTNYFPIQTDSDFIKKPFDSLAFDKSIEGAGQLKSRQKGANNPIMLEDVTSALVRQQKFVSQYAGLAIPLSNFNKVLNVTLTDYAGSMKQTINQKWGSNAMKYIEHMVADLNGARAKSDGDFISRTLAKSRSGMAGAVLTLNPSVTMKQAASYPTAAAVVGYRDLAAGMLNARNYRPGTLEKLINKYTAEYYFRSLGNSTQELGDLASQNSYLTAIKKVPVAGTLVNSIQEVDLLTTRAIWLACENNISRTTDLQKGSDTYYRKVAELYNKAIHDTQPNYSVMQRPEVLRSTNEVTKGLTMFMTQRLQNGNILIDSANNLKAKKKAYKKSKTADTKAALAKAQNEFAHAVTSQALSAIVLSSMTLASRALLHKMNPYRDDDKDITSDALIQQFITDALSSVAGSFLLGAEIFEFVSAKITGDKYYGLSDNITSSVSELVDAVSTAIDNYNKAQEEDADVEGLAKDTMLTVAAALGQVTGVPIKNVKNIIDAAMLHYEDSQNEGLGSFEAGNDRKTAILGDKYYDALVDGDAAGIEKWHDALIEKGKDEKAIAGIVSDHLKETPEIQSAYEAKESGNYMVYSSVLEDLEADGFNQADIMSAIKKYENKLKKAEVVEVAETDDFGDVAVDSSADEVIVDTAEARGNGSTKSIYTVDMLEAALEADDTESVDAITEDMANAKYNSAIAKGKTAEEAEEAADKALKSSIKKAYKDRLVDAFMEGDTAETKRIADILDDYGFTGDDFRSMVSEPIKEKFLNAYEENDSKTMKEAMQQAIDAGYDENAVRGWTNIKADYVSAYEAGNKSEAAQIAKKAESLGYSEEAILKWVGRTKISDTTDSIEKAVSDKGNYSTDNIVKYRDAWCADYAEEHPDKTEWEVRSAFKAALTSYFSVRYTDMSQEDRNRLQNILNGYCWYGKSAKRSKPYDYSKWIGKTSTSTDDEDEDDSKKPSKLYW